MSEERWRKLDVWRQADELAFEIGEYKELEAGYERLGKSLWKFYEAVRDGKD